MNYTGFSYNIFSLGDAAITVDFGNYIDIDINKEVIARFNQLQQTPLPGMIEAVPAYSSLTVYYDVAAIRKLNPGLTAFETMQQLLEERLKQPILQKDGEERIIKIPVCYDTEFASDIQQLAAVKNISVEEVISFHTAKSYNVYMLGFLPGFAYMGEVDEKIATPRKSQPVNVAAGSVGIAGKQTGIYPLASPGGWQIIGRTPLKLFNAASLAPTLLRVGDLVQFYPINKSEFEKIKITESIG
ncbi:MAG: 5-oxoprolinase subunit PxpB [Chitinophagaceae bacterium]|nr:5-oxoprolinase subunit PxpB [Chitinophagaceae bacterium]